MTIRTLLEIIDEKRELFPALDDYSLATVTQTIEEYSDSFTLNNKVVFNHALGIVIIEAS